MNVLFWYCCISIMSTLTLVNSQRHINLREKLERLVRDPEYNEFTNEIHKPRQIQGMLLKDLNEYDMFDTSSEERFFRKLSKTLERISAASVYTEEKSALVSTTEITTTATTAATTLTSDTINEESPTITAMSQQKPSRVIGSLSSIISRLINLWRN